MDETITLSAQLFQYFITGITIGSIYAMVALGFNIIYNVTEIINFAQGEFVMLGGLVMVQFHTTLALPWLPAFILTILLVMAVGILIDRLAIRNIRRPTVLNLIIATIAVSITLKGAAMLVWGKDPYDLPAFSGREIIELFGAAIQPQALWVLAFLVIIVAGLSLFFDHSIMGKAMRACADNPAAASLVGIRPRRMVLYSFALSAAIGAMAGMVITPISFMDYDRGAMLAVKSFGAVILGGLGSFPGAILGGLIIGLTESFGAGLLSSGYKDAFALIILLLALNFRPNGLLGNVEIGRIKKF